MKTISKNGFPDVFLADRMMQGVWRCSKIIIEPQVSSPPIRFSFVIILEDENVVIVRKQKYP